jgi:hypothetical protein
MCASCARQSLSENVSILASAANCYIETAARGILLSIAKCDQMTAQERQRNRPLHPLDAEAWSSRSSLATSVGDGWYSRKRFVDQRKRPLVPPDVRHRPAARSTRTDDSTEWTRRRATQPRAGTARTTDRARSTNRLSTRSENANCSRSGVSPTDSSASVEDCARCDTYRGSCRHEQPIDHRAQAIVPLGRGHRSPRTRHRAPWCNAPVAKIHRSVRRAEATRRERRGIGPHRTTM